ncbi:hypothetical protein ACEQ8H_006477 [Pleosporales sp. CAS-2024a]
MADVAASAQLAQWTFEKHAMAARPERSGSDSAASSPLLCDAAPDTLRIDAPPSEHASPAPRKESSIVLQDRYLSSEEALSPASDASDSDYDSDDAVIHDPANHAKPCTMSMSRWEKGRSCDMAVMVSYAFAGRPKVVELDCRSPTVDAPPMQPRSASLAHLPIAAITQLRNDAAHRLSIKATTATRLSPTPSSTRSISPAIDELLARPALAPVPLASSARSSVCLPTNGRNRLSRVQTTQSYRAPPTPASPAPHAFLSSDPYETSNKDSSSPIIKPPHKRLRSISMKLALAKIAITNPSKKTYDSRIHGKFPPPTPSTPHTPLTPQTAPLEGSSTFISPQKLRRASTILRPKSRGRDSIIGPLPELAPPVPTVNTSAVAQKRMTMTRMQARGADEREPTLVLPPCPSDTEDDPMTSFKSRPLRKRKSLMSLMDSL